MKRPHISEGQIAFDLDDTRTADEADAQWVQEYREAQDMDPVASVSTVTAEMGAQALSGGMLGEDDVYDRYVEQGTMSPDEARAHRAGITSAKLAYLDKRRELALKSLTNLPNGTEKEQKIAEIYQRFPL